MSQRSNESLDDAKKISVVIGSNFEDQLSMKEEKDQQKLDKLNDFIDCLLGQINQEYEKRKELGKYYPPERLNALLGNIGLLQFVTMTQGSGSATGYYSSHGTPPKYEPLVSYITGSQTLGQNQDQVDG